MKSTVQFTLDTEVVAELGKLPRGKPSALINNYLRNYFNLGIENKKEKQK